jgi:hypothetical protein
MQVGSAGRRIRGLKRGVLAIAIAVSVLSLVPATAAGGNVKRPLLLVHGHEHDSGNSCNGTWKNLMANYRVMGYTGQFRAIHYYKNDAGCSTYYGKGSAPWISSATSDTPIQYISKKLAWYIYNSWTSHGIGVNVVAHSMGGLIVRYAIDQVQRKKPGWPPQIIVPNVFTFGTPHDGIDEGPFQVGCIFTGNNDDQCRQMDKSSSFIEYLRDNARNPQGHYGTWWSLAGSDDDDTVNETSATDMSVDFKIHWASDANIEHPDYMHEKDHDDFTTGTNCWTTTTGGSLSKGRCYWPLQWSFWALAYNGY